MKESLNNKKKFYEPQIESKFIFERKTNLLKNEISPIAFMKGKEIGLTYSKSRNLINDNLNYDLSRMTPDEFDFVQSRKKSKELIDTIINIKDKEALIDIIYKSLSYDNTSQYVIYTALERLFSLGYEKEYYEILKQYKMGISEEMIIDKKNNIKTVNINNLFPPKGFIPKNIEHIKSIFIQIIEIIVLIANISIWDLNNIKIQYEVQDDNMVLIEEKTENKILEEHKEIIEFKKIYTKIRYLKKFYNNQPIEYKLNPVLFFYHMINLIMDIFLLEDKKSDIITISFNNEALEQIIDIKDYINNTLLYNLKNYKIYTNEIDMLIKLFIYYIDSKIKFNLPIPFDNCIIKKNEANLTKKYTEEFVEKQKKNKKTFLNELKIEENKFIIGNANSCIPFKYSNYEASLLDKIIKARSTKNLDIIRYKYMYISEFQRDNFFDENELIYLKDIFRDIINSRCFDELFSLYSDYKFLPLNILKNKSIQDYIIDNIMFLPYDEKMFDTQSFTFSFNGQICLSGYPFCSTVEYKDQKVYHILELARKLIQLMHEYCHAIKRYLNIVTNGLIYSETYDEKNNKEEAGFLFEYILFGWEHNDYFNNNICYDNNRILWKQKIDVNTALKMLNIDLYNYDISSIQDILYNNKNSPSYIDFENKKINEKLVKFLFDLGFDTKEKINILKKNKSTIKVSRNEQNYNLIDVGSEGRNHINKHA